MFQAVKSGFMAALILMIALPPLSVVVPSVDGQLFPVTTPKDTFIEFIEVRDGTERPINIYISGEANKLRACKFRKLQWHVGTRDNPLAAKVDHEFLETAKGRDVGVFPWGRWKLHLHWTDITHNSHADVWHQCYVFGLPLPWWTRSKFYG